MFISVNFPIADFRALHRECAGRLQKPSWGSTDPQAAFARGFGSMHTRTKSGIGFVGENYYADCDNLIKYPSQNFVKPLVGINRKVLAYPIYRRFYFDGLMAGRFELGFRLNEPSIWDIGIQYPNAEYDAANTSLQFLESLIQVKLLDGRDFVSKVHKAMDLLCDGWLLSSTKTKDLKIYEIRSICTRYVGVGTPFVFIRAGSEIKLTPERQSRGLLKNDDLEVFTTRSGIHGQQFDTTVNPSKHLLDQETAKERLVRLFYTQIRTLAYAHSFYLKQVSSGAIEGPTSLDVAVKSIVDRLKNLSPVDGNDHDDLNCKEMKKILQNLDIDVAKLTAEIENRVRPSWIKQKLSTIFGYVDKKADKAIEAAASAATKQTLSGF